MKNDQSFFELATPFDMLEKAKRELYRIKNCIHIDYVYNFYVTAYHIKDYVEIKNPEKTEELKKFLSHPDLENCRILCNRGKHLKLIKKDPKSTIVYDNAPSGNTPIGSMILSGGADWVLITSEGQFVDVIDLAEKIIIHWSEFLAQ